MPETGEEKEPEPENQENTTDYSNILSRMTLNPLLIRTPPRRQRPAPRNGGGIRSAEMERCVQPFTELDTTAHLWWVQSLVRTMQHRDERP